MKILCLMPTYGRRAALLENSIQLFLNQTHPDKHLLIFDDLGTLEKTKLDVPHVSIISTPLRQNSIGAKYNTMMNIPTSLKFDAVAVWDDDDIYLPHHLSTHVDALEARFWSKPSTIVSSYFTPPREEDASGRFHGSIAIRVDYLKFFKELTGSMWIDTRRATFDQEMLQKLSSRGVPGDPTTLAPPSYVYRWGSSGAGHCSGLMGDTEWYLKYRPDSTEPIPSLTPKLDDDTVNTLQLLSQKTQQHMS